jgi:ABC-type bacteriocin/lantibiotic exporter with double-glycine peptidase domain
MIAIIGPNGAGKSTLLKAILGQQEYSGVISFSVPGQRNRKLKIGYVPQNMTLFNASVRHNIAFGIPEDQIDDDKLRNAMELAQVTAFIDSLPEKENTVIGEAGLRLSGGQRQRIVIARALYREPELLILDEATSALDNDTEKAIIDALKTLKGKLTIIMIAHRLSSIEHCDRVISLDK